MPNANAEPILSTLTKCWTWEEMLRANHAAGRYFWEPAKLAGVYAVGEPFSGDYGVYGVEIHPDGAAANYLPREVYRIIHFDPATGRARMLEGAHGVERIAIDEARLLAQYGPRQAPGK